MKAGRLLVVLILMMAVLVTSCQSLKGRKVKPSGDKTVLNVSGMVLTNLDVSRNTNLTELGCVHCQLTFLDVSRNSGLKGLECNDNHLTNLDISVCTNLQILWCYENYLTNLNVAACTHLQVLACDDNQLTNLDISACTNLETLDCHGNCLAVLNISSNKVLWLVDATNNPLTEIIVWWSPATNIPPNVQLLYDGNPVLKNWGIKATVVLKNGKRISGFVKWNEEKREYIIRQNDTTIRWIPKSEVECVEGKDVPQSEVVPVNPFKTILYDKLLPAHAFN